MRGCEKLAELYGAYIYGEVTLEEKRDILDHLEACEKCRVDVEARRAVIDKIPNALPRLSDDDRQAVALAVMSGVRKQKEERSWWRTVSPLLQTASVAATIVIVFAGGAMFGFHLKDKARMATPPPMPETNAPVTHPNQINEVRPQQEIVPETTAEPAPITTADSFDRQLTGPGTSRLGWNPRSDWTNGPWSITEEKADDSSSQVEPKPEEPAPDGEKVKEQDKENKPEDTTPVSTPPYLWNEQGTEDSNQSVGQ